MLKTAQYPNWGWPVVGQEFGKVAYTTFDNCCYYSGLQPSYGPSDAIATSTINAAESIIADILQREKRSWNDLCFFDLETRKGYHYPSGIYTITQPNLGPSENGEYGFRVENWKHDLECPGEVEKSFKELIGNLEIKIWNPEEAHKAGYQPSTHHSRTSGYWIREIDSEKEIAEMLYKASARQTFSKLFLGHQPQNCILVDQKGFPKYLKMSEEDRYCIWRRALLRDN